MGFDSKPELTWDIMANNLTKKQTLTTIKNPWEQALTGIAGDQNKQKELHDLYAPYLAVMTEYHHLNPDWKFWDNNPNIGWKFHLDVPPENVIAVSEFLKTYNGKGFRHKYLNGSAVEQGKVFTVYTGSKNDTEKAVKEIYDHTQHLIQNPRVNPSEINGETEFAPNIYGRFVGAKKDGFQEYGHNGISFLQGDSGQILRGLKTPDQCVQNAKDAAQKIYGDYFGGNITPYQP